MWESGGVAAHILNLDTSSEVSDSSMACPYCRQGNHLSNPLTKGLGVPRASLDTARDQTNIPTELALLHEVIMFSTN
jgi:hypothetical protein